MDWIFDERTNCWSVMTTMRTADYVGLVKRAHSAQGALEGQRDVLRTTSAKRIRARMLEDIGKGAVLPPVVVGAVLDGLAIFETERPDTIEELVALVAAKDVSIIDGMQRTQAIMDAIDADPGAADRDIRVEFWLADSVRALVYRMLILNTSQVPWTIHRQLSVVFEPLLADLRASVPTIEKLTGPDGGGRRVGPAQYSMQSLIEFYIAFSLRKSSFDTKEALSEEFSRLDFVDNLSEPEFQDQFYRAIASMVELDKAFSRLDADLDNDVAMRGRGIFDRQPARIGFAVAMGMHVLGRPGSEPDVADRARKSAEVASKISDLVTRLEELGVDDLTDYLRCDVLAEVLDRRVGQVGRYERGVFLEAFRVLIEEGFALPNLEPCWRAG